MKQEVCCPEHCCVDFEESLPDEPGKDGIYFVDEAWSGAISFFQGWWLCVGEFRTHLRFCPWCGKEINVKQKAVLDA